MESVHEVEKWVSQKWRVGMHTPRSRMKNTVGAKIVQRKFTADLLCVTDVSLHTVVNVQNIVRPSTIYLLELDRCN